MLNQKIETPALHEVTVFFKSGNTIKFKTSNFTCTRNDNNDLREAKWSQVLDKNILFFDIKEVEFIYSEPINIL